MLQLGDASIYCRDEMCDRLGLHYARRTCGEDFRNKIKSEAKQKLKHNGRPRWRKLREGEEPPKDAEVRAYPDGSRSYAMTQPWHLSAPRALDHCIAKAVSKTYPKPIDVIFDEIQDDYGECDRRAVERHLKKLVDRGQLLRVDLGRRLSAYLRPGSSLVKDVTLMREQIEALYEQTFYGSRASP